MYKEMIESNWIYIGIFLDEKSKRTLKELYPAPEGWKEYYDHMTVVFNDGTEIANAVKSINEKNIDSIFNLRVVGPGISDKAYAVQVELPRGVVSANKITHITLATSETGSAVDSNYITNWGTIIRSKVYPDLYISGKMKVFYPTVELKSTEVEMIKSLGGNVNYEVIFEEANVY